MSFWKVIVVLILGLVALWTFESLGWIGRDPAADTKVTTPKGTAPGFKASKAPKAPTATARRPALRPAEIRRAMRHGPTREARVHRAPSEGPRAEVSVPTIAEYDVKLPDRTRYTLGNHTLGYTITILKVQVVPSGELNILIQAQSSTSRSARVSDRQFSLLTNGGWIEPNMSFGERFNPGESPAVEVIFDIPPALSSTVLRIKEYGDTVEIPLNLTPPPSPQ